METELFQVLDDLRAHGRLSQPLDILYGNFDASELAVIAHPELSQTERAHERLGVRDAVEALGRNFDPVRDARCETRRRGLVPRFHATRARQLTDLVFT